MALDAAEDGAAAEDAGIAARRVNDALVVGGELVPVETDVDGVDPDESDLADKAPADKVPADKVEGDDARPTLRVPAEDWVDAATGAETGIGAGEGGGAAAGCDAELDSA